MFASYVLLAVFGMASAELLSGSSPLWFVSPWALLVTFPLYFLHIVFLWSVAKKKKKTAWYQLYFLGVMFALYEAWITKVLWIGYPSNGGFVFGEVAGVGIGEYVALVLWWHPVMSFIVPIALYQLISGKVLPEFQSLLQYGKKKWRLILALVVGCGPIVATSHGFFAPAAWFTILGTFLMVALLRKRQLVDIRALAVSRMGFWAYGILLTLLYLVTYPKLVPEGIPQTVEPIVVILLTYVVAVYLFARSQKATSTESVLGSEFFSWQQIRTVFLVFGVSVTIFSVLPPVAIIGISVWYIALMTGGVYIAVAALKARSRERK